MSDMKCPFCDNPLQPTLRQSDEYWCENYDCPRTNIEWVGSQKLWQELIRTCKALETLQEFITKLYLNGNITDEQLERYKKTLITALEQKDK